MVLKVNSIILQWKKSNLCEQFQRKEKEEVSVFFKEANKTLILKTDQNCVRKKICGST